MVRNEANIVVDNLKVLLIYKQILFEKKNKPKTTQKQQMAFLTAMIWHMCFGA